MSRKTPPRRAQVTFMETTGLTPNMTRAEQETQTEAGRLMTHIERALAAVAVRTSTDEEELEACADALERSARNLVAALRELAHERKRQQDSDE